MLSRSRFIVYTCRGEPGAHTSPMPVQRCHAGSSTSAVVGVFTPWKWANTINQGISAATSDRGVLNIRQPPAPGPGAAKRHLQPPGHLAGKCVPFRGRTELHQPPARDNVKVDRFVCWGPSQVGGRKVEVFHGPLRLWGHSLAQPQGVLTQPLDSWRELGVGIVSL